MAKIRWTRLLLSASQTWFAVEQRYHSKCLSSTAPCDQALRRHLEYRPRLQPAPSKSKWPWVQTQLGKGGVQEMVAIWMVSQGKVYNKVESINRVKMSQVGLNSVLTLPSKSSTIRRMRASCEVHELQRKYRNSTIPQEVASYLPIHPQKTRLYLTRLQLLNFLDLQIQRAELILWAREARAQAEHLSCFINRMVVFKAITKVKVASLEQHQLTATHQGEIYLMPPTIS